jgi:hypothetical protein
VFDTQVFALAHSLIEKQIYTHTFPRRHSGIQLHLKSFSGRRGIIHESESKHGTRSGQDQVEEAAPLPLLHQRESHAEAVHGLAEGRETPALYFGFFRADPQRACQSATPSSIIRT